MKLREEVDVIAFDQRGTGMSGKLLNYPNTIEFELFKPSYKEEYIDKTNANFSKYLEYWNDKNILGGFGTVGISTFELQLVVATFYLKHPSDNKNLPGIYTQIYQGNFSEIAPDVMVIKKYVLNRISPMALLMDIQFGISDERRKKVSEQIATSTLGSSINFLLCGWMMYIKFSQLPYKFREMAETDGDGLLLSGTLDGRTYVNVGT